MAQLAAGIQAIGTIVSAGGQLNAGRAAATAGRAQQQALDYQAAALDQQAGQERASSQRRAMDERRRAEIAMSRGQAVAAASGAGALDESVVNTLSDIAGEGEYNALSALFTGEERARGLEGEAGLRRYQGAEAARQGEVAKQAYRTAAIATVLSGFGRAGSSLASKYGDPEGPPTGKRLNAGIADGAYSTVYDSRNRDRLAYG